MTGRSRRLDLGAAIGLWLMAWPSLAQDPYRIRGSIVDVDMPKIEVKRRDGEHLDVTLNESTRLFVVTPGQLDDLSEGQFVGITSIVGRDDRQEALEVHIFAEELRGLGEGHYPWDLVDEHNMMTNATIAEIAMIDGGPSLTVTYTKNNGQQQNEDQLWIDIPPTIPIVHLAKGTPIVLAPGKDVFLYVNESDAGGPIPLAIIVGDGVHPPM